MNSFKAGTNIVHNSQKEYEYESFLPVRVNREFYIEDQRLFAMLEEATRLLGELNAYARLVPDVDYFIQMHVRSEAVSSSAIEGTKTGMNEALLPEEEINPERRDDWHEVHNYIQAMNWAVEETARLPVSVRLSKEIHKRLLPGVRGESKMPGAIRTSQNWIGGSSIKTAHFVPPHHTNLADLLSDWENFWHNKAIATPILIRTAILHYQFETIHPFLDGNGRIGRLLITLQLIERGFLNKPVLYLSAYFEKHRQAYYDALDRVRIHNDLEGFIKFFLEGIIETSNNGRRMFEDIIRLRESYDQKVAQLGRKVPQARQLLLHLFSQPLVDVKDVAKLLNVGYDPANNLIKDFESLGILEETTGYSRNRLFRMTDYVNLFERM